MNKIELAKKYLKERRIDGWLLYDFHKCNPLAHQFLEIPVNKMTTRRFFYFIPVEGVPIKLVHAIEAHLLDHLPGEKRIYASWQKLEEGLQRILTGYKKIAMEYSPRNEIPYVSKVDGGTVDLVRSFGVEVVSSADFLLYFTSHLTPTQIASQKRAARACEEIVFAAWGLVAQNTMSDYDVADFIEEEYERRGLVSDGPPIVALNSDSADPHFETKGQGAKKIKKGDFLLIDLWAKEKGEGAVFGDLTRVAVVGREPIEKERQVFSIVRRAQKAAIELVTKRFHEKKGIQGWEVDRAARQLIWDEGYGDFFIHRTGHNIGVELHGSGTHMDDLEMHDVRPIIKGSCFSVEPGIYLPGEFGVRLESDVQIHEDGTVEVTGGVQDSIQVL